MSDHFTNKPVQNRFSGVFTGLFVAFFLAFVIQGIEFWNIETSQTGPRYKISENMPFFIAYIIGTIIFYILMKKYDKSTFEDIERLIDD